MSRYVFPPRCRTVPAKANRDKAPPPPYRIGDVQAPNRLPSPQTGYGRRTPTVRPLQATRRQRPPQMVGRPVRRMRQGVRQPTGTTPAASSDRIAQRSSYSAFFTFGFLPVRLHLFERHLRQFHALLVGPFLDMFETADKLLVAPFKRILGVDTVQTRHIDQSEQQVAQPPLPSGRGPSVRFPAGVRPSPPAPSPTHPRACPSRNRQRQPSARYGTPSPWPVGCAVPRQHPPCVPCGLSCASRRVSAPLPIVYHLSGTVGLYIAVDMRMSVYQLIAQCIDHIAYIETPLFRPHARIEDDVEQQVAQAPRGCRPCRRPLSHRSIRTSPLWCCCAATRKSAPCPTDTLPGACPSPPEQALHGLKPVSRTCRIFICMIFRSGRQTTNFRPERKITQKGVYAEKPPQFPCISRTGHKYRYRPSLRGNLPGQAGKKRQPQEHFGLLRLPPDPAKG